ncbi:hypothetical protein DP939_15820 [Spongiactinospora rosea]|uniref:AMP-dependent synthetase/ligase domain-containing protein n=1 Tax=Spongiactinospora rosea TaxID=2248750 RepID=A0A366M028_9ACTN|nr:hypothetical protein DP939_15820 [Spongiactinospora rosea]
MECGTESITYGELWAESAKAAARISAGPNHRPGGLVATLFERGTACVIEQLAVWRSGCAYLPLDPALPDGRLRSILADARPQSVEVSPRLRRRLDAGARPSGWAAEDATAYVIYTSGSTGTPKGVAVGHGSLADLVNWHRETYLTGPGTRVAAFAGLGFDASAWECWSTLASGATLVLPPAPVAGGIVQIIEFLTVQKIDVCFLSTPLAEQMEIGCGCTRPGISRPRCTITTAQRRPPWSPRPPAICETRAMPRCRPLDALSGMPKCVWPMPPGMTSQSLGSTANF